MTGFDAALASAEASGSENSDIVPSQLHNTVLSSYLGANRSVQPAIPELPSWTSLPVSAEPSEVGSDQQQDELAAAEEYSSNLVTHDAQTAVRSGYTVASNKPSHTLVSGRTARTSRERQSKSSRSRSSTTTQNVPIVPGARHLPGIVMSASGSHPQGVSPVDFPSRGPIASSSSSSSSSSLPVPPRSAKRKSKFLGVFITTPSRSSSSKVPRQGSQNLVSDRLALKPSDDDEYAELHYTSASAASKDITSSLSSITAYDIGDEVETPEERTATPLFLPSWQSAPSSSFGTLRERTSQTPSASIRTSQSADPLSLIPPADASSEAVNTTEPSASDSPPEKRVQRRASETDDQTHALVDALSTAFQQNAQTTYVQPADVGDKVDKTRRSSARETPVEMVTVTDSKEKVRVRPTVEARKVIVHGAQNRKAVALSQDDIDRFLEIDVATVALGKRRDPGMEDDVETPGEDREEAALRNAVRFLNPSPARRDGKQTTRGRGAYLVDGASLMEKYVTRVEEWFGSQALWNLPEGKKSKKVSLIQVPNKSWRANRFVGKFESAKAANTVPLEKIERLKQQPQHVAGNEPDA